MSDSLTESSMTLRDAELLADPSLISGVDGVAPFLFRQVDLQYGGNLHTVLGRASTPNYADINNLEIARGRGIDETDYNARSRVIVLGPETVQAIFPDDIDPLDQDIRVNGITFRVIGVLTEKGASGIGGSQDDIALIPLTTAQERLFDSRSASGEFLVDAILMQASSDEAIDGIIIDASNVLRQSHNITFRDDDDFQILTQSDFVQAFGAVTGVLTLFLGAIASISLLVGGIGIMNIMLVSVTERTREIGLRMAVGARRGDILVQFALESVALSLAGGLIGLALGVGGAVLISKLGDWPSAIPVWAAPVSLGFSMVVGLVFGAYPAWRAARLDPIEALRRE